MKCFAWDDAKNPKLKADRRIGFEDVFHIERGDLLDILEHPNPEPVRRPRGFSATIDSLNHQERSLDAIRPDSYARTVTSLTKHGAID